MWGFLKCNIPFTLGIKFHNNYLFQCNFPLLINVNKYIDNESFKCTFT